MQGVLIALIPEGLPLGLAAGLTVIAKRLCDKHFVLLKKLETVETLGSMSMLASDKTGTLTQASAPAHQVRPQCHCPTDAPRLPPAERHDRRQRRAWLLG